jgi:hypothetical protein
MRSKRLISALLFFSAAVIVTVQLQSRGYSTEKKIVRVDKAHNVLKDANSFHEAVHSYVVKHNQVVSDPGESKYEAQYLIYFSDPSAGENIEKQI